MNYLPEEDVDPNKDYRELDTLFAKYLDHIGQCLGEILLPDEVIRERPLPSKVSFTPEELATLNRLADARWRASLTPGGRAVCKPTK